MTSSDLSTYARLWSEERDGTRLSENPEPGGRSSGTACNPGMKWHLRRKSRRRNMLLLGMIVLGLAVFVAMLAFVELCDWV